MRAFDWTGGGKGEEGGGGAHSKIYPRATVGISVTPTDELNCIHVEVMQLTSIFRCA